MDTRANLGIVTEVGMQIYVAKFSTAETSVANFASAAARRGTFSSMGRACATHEWPM